MPTIPIPIAPRRPHSITQHGQTRVDEYFWMRDREDPAVLDYLHAEDGYQRELTRHTEALREELFLEMKARIKETDESVPARDGDYLYYTRVEAGRQHPLYLRRGLAPGAPEELLLDQNLIAAESPSCRIGAFAVSPDGRSLAFSVDPDGSERCVLRIKDLASGTLLPESIPNTAGDIFDHGGIAWAADSQSFFYATLDGAMRPFKIHRHVLGADPSTDSLIHHEVDEAFYLSVTRMRSGRFILMSFFSHGGTETRFIPADRPDADFTVLAPRVKDVEYQVEHHDGRFLILTNEGAVNFRLMEAAEDSVDRRAWREIIPHRPDVLLDSLFMFRNHMVVVERSGGLQRLRVSTPDGRGALFQVPFPEPVYTIAPQANPWFEADSFRFKYSSLVTPPSIIDFHLDTRVWELRKRDEIPSGYDPDRFTCERLFATAPDGAQVPLSIVHRKGLAPDGKNPTLLYGYGAYGISLDPGFDANRLSLLERGFVFALAHVRGGQEMGRAWYEEGRRRHKKNSFTDFIACAERLTGLGYASPSSLAIMGGSAGGLLVSASLTMRPDLCKAAIAEVPFVDVISTMSDPEIPLTVIEWEEWGNPAELEAFEYMLSYSPYDNLRQTVYPDILLTAGLNDPRVAYWEPAKFSARLRALKRGESLVLLKCDFGAGHAGPSGRYDYLKEIAYKYAFLIDRLGAR